MNRVTHKPIANREVNWLPRTPRRQSDRSTTNSRTVAVLQACHPERSTRIANRLAIEFSRMVGRSLIEIALRFESCRRRKCWRPIRLAGRLRLATRRRLDANNGPSFGHSRQAMKTRPAYTVRERRGLPTIRPHRPIVRWIELQYQVQSFLR